MHLRMPYTRHLTMIKFFIIHILVLPINQSKATEEHICTTGGVVNVRGTCKRVSECPTALSNLRAGITPSVCYMENDETFICCPNERRISETRCEEYYHQIKAVLSPDNIQVIRGCYSRKQAWALNKISGGRNAEPNEVSYMAAIGYLNGVTNEVDWKCGGTLISEQFVLTAAHCLIDEQPTHILLGTKHLYSEEPSRVEAAIEKIYIHPQYFRPMKYNDLGLIKLSKKVDFNEFLYPACLPQPNKRLEKINTILTAGWGRLEFFGKRGEMLQVTNLNRYHIKDCAEAYGFVDYHLKSALPMGLIKSQLCAGDRVGNSDTCDGDSGGPLIVKENITDCVHFVVGITSFGAQFCGSGVPAIYTNVQTFLDWIEDIVWGIPDEILHH